MGRCTLILLKSTNESTALIDQLNARADESAIKPEANRVPRTAKREGLIRFRIHSILLLLMTKTTLPGSDVAKIVLLKITIFPYVFPLSENLNEYRLEEY